MPPLKTAAFDGGFFANNPDWGSWYISSTLVSNVPAGGRPASLD